MMVDHCTHHEQNPLIHLRHITTYKFMLLFGTEPRYILHASSSYCGRLLYQLWTKSTLSFPRYHNIHLKVLTNIALITQICHGAKCNFTCISNTWYLITVPNVNQIIPFFSEIAQQIHKVYEKVAIITQICQSQILFYVYQQPMVSDHGYWYQIWGKSIQPSWRNVQGQTNVCTVLAGKMDWWTMPIPIFSDYAIAERGVINHTHAY